MFQNWEARTKWLILAPKITEILDEFEQTLNNYNLFADDLVEHHEESGFLKKFPHKS